MYDNDYDDYLSDLEGGYEEDWDDAYEDATNWVREDFGWFGDEALCGE